jgi:hypothetical protein
VRLFFSNTANQLSLSAGVVASDTILLFSGTATGWPSSPCKAVIDPDTDLAEVVLITAIGPSSFTVARGQDGTAAQNHVAGAIVEHRWSAAEADEANVHANLDGGVHGITGDVVGTDDVQTLENKHLVSPTVDTATFQASDTSPAQASKAATTGTANIAEFQDPSGVALTRVGQHGEVVVSVTDAATTPLNVKMAAGQTADGYQLRKSDNSIPFKVDKDGDVTAASVTTPGAVAAASAAITGDVATATVHASGAVSAASVAATGAVTAGSVAATGAVTGNNLPKVRTADAGVLIQKGTFSQAFSADTSLTNTQSFPQAFSSATGVVVTMTAQFPSNLDIIPALNAAPTASGFTWRLYNKDGTAQTGTVVVHWIAIGPG